MTIRFLESVVVVVLATSAPILAPRGDAQTVEPTGRTIQVPLEYENPGNGKAPLYFELGAPFDENKPVILVIADGQQFYLRRGAIKALQESTFGSAFNVVGIVTRGTQPEFIKAATSPDGKPDWIKAWHIFNSSQWIEDIESVRKAVVGETGTVFLYGRSGGAYLVHQYLAKYGNHAQRVFTQSAVEPFIAHDLGIGLDRYWSELAVQDGALQPLLKSALAKHSEERLGILITLQRQHFYLSADKLPAARRDLILALDKGDMAFYQRLRKEYDVDDVMKMSESNDIIPQNVRVVELIYPSGAFQVVDDSAIFPLIETQRHFLEPLLSLIDAGKIPAPSYDPSGTHRLQTEVFILAGSRDEAVDYRTSIALAYRYPKHFLFIADDNHVYSKLVETGISSQLIQSFFRSGLESEDFGRAVKNATPYRWQER